MKKNIKSNKEYKQKNWHVTLGYITLQRLKYITLRRLKYITLQRLRVSLNQSQSEFEFGIIHLLSWQTISKNWHFLPRDTHMYVCVSGGNKF